MGLYRAEGARIVTACPFKAELEERRRQSIDKNRKNNYLKSVCKEFAEQERKTSKDEVLRQET